MKLLKHILLPVALDDRFKHQRVAAEKLATAFGSKLYLYHCLPAYKKTDANAKHLLVQKLKTRLKEEYAYYAGKGIDTEIRPLDSGIPSDGILEAARLTNANLILFGRVGEHGHNEVKVQAVLEKSTVPVWVENLDKSVFDESGIACAYDGSSSSLRSLKNAVKICEVFKSPLHVLHFTNGEDASIESGLKEHLEDLHIVYKSMHCVELEDGNTKALYEYLQKHEIRLLFMGVFGRHSGNVKKMGNVARLFFEEYRNLNQVYFYNEDLLRLEVSGELDELNNIVSEAEKFLKDDMISAAQDAFRHALKLDKFCLPAWDGLSEVAKKQKQLEKSEEFRRRADKIRESYWNRYIEMDIRSQKQRNGDYR